MSEDLYVESPVSGVFHLAEQSPLITAEGEVLLGGALFASVGGIEIFSPVDGWLMQLFVSDGEEVAAGQAVARLRPLAI